MMLTPRGIRVARIAKSHGMHSPYVAADEANRAGMTYYLAYALMEQETGDGSNVFGHDPTIFVGAGHVTEDKYHAYRKQRGTTHMQGVGPVQLTWWQTQDEADRAGGCWRPRFNLRVGFRTLWHLVKTLGYEEGCERYNGTGPNAVAYSKSLREKAEKWRKRLN